MSIVMDYQQCPQCKFERADREYNCRTFEESLGCRKCGYSEGLDREEDSEGKSTYKHKAVEGAGVLFYRRKGAIGYTCHYLATQDEVAKADQWLREKLATGQVRTRSAYLSSWNEETRSVDFIIGRLNEISDYDLDDEIPEQMGPNDLRPFQIVEQRCQVKLRYSCKHIVDGWILLLHRQPVPVAAKVFRADVPCLECLPQYIDPLGISGADETAASLVKCRTRLWENRWLDGSGEYVTPAFDHPQTLEEAASRFYAAYPERKQCHPESTRFHLQLEGWSDEDIAAKKWLCDCAGCRATPMSLGCEEYPG